jgi:hypothetical protein
MPPKTLRFRARGTALVQHFEALDAGCKRFVGRKYIQINPDAIVRDPEMAPYVGQWGFAHTGDAEEVPYRAEYVAACQAGDLWPADEETAAACSHPHSRVAFDPTFGSEVHAITKPASPAEKG